MSLYFSFSSLYTRFLIIIALLGITEFLSEKYLGRAFILILFVNLFKYSGIHFIIILRVMLMPWKCIMHNIRHISHVKYAVLRIRSRWIRKILASWIRIQGAKFQPKTTKKAFLLSKLKSELLKKERL